LAKKSVDKSPTVTGKRKQQKKKREEKKKSFFGTPASSVIVTFSQFSMSKGC
jgi:hypothetical protein